MDRKSFGIWCSAFASVPEPCREERKQRALTLSCSCKTGGQMDSQIPPRRPAVVEDVKCLSKLRC